MTQVKLKAQLRPGLYATLTIKLEIPPVQRGIAEGMGIGPQEQDNLMGQKLQEILLLLGNSDEI